MNPLDFNIFNNIKNVLLWSFVSFVCLFYDAVLTFFSSSPFLMWMWAEASCGFPVNICAAFNLTSEDAEWSERLKQAACSSDENWTSLQQTPACLPSCFVCVGAGTERGQRAALRLSLDGHRDHPLLLLHLQSSQSPAVPHQMGQVGKSDGGGWFSMAEPLFKEHFRGSNIKTWVSATSSHTLLFNTHSTTQL